VAIDDASSLVKFCSFESGLKILNSQSLRWSAPHLLNDPFEVHHKSNPDFTPQTLLSSMIKEAVSLLFGPNEPTGKANRIIAAICRWREEDRFASEEEAEQVLKQLLSQIAQQQQESIDLYMTQWRNFSRSLRICSFIDKPNNQYGWQRYADNHAGIALRFSTGHDTALTNPKRVHYDPTPPTIISLKQQIAVTYGREKTPTANTEDFVDKVLRKNRINHAEREWRCFSIDTSEPNVDEQLWYTNKKFTTPELKAVYLGLACSSENKNAVINLVRNNYKSTKIYQAHTLPNRYEIDFQLLVDQ